MYIYRKIMAIILLSSVLLANNSCAPAREGGFLKVFDSAAEAIIEGERNGVAFSAELILSEKGGDGMRDGEMTFTSPDSMRGIRVVMASGVYACELDGIVFSGAPAERLGAPLGAFVQRGDAVSAEKLEAEDGRMLTRIVIASELGKIEYLLDSKTGVPISVREEDGEGTPIMEFKIEEYKIIR